MRRAVEEVSRRSKTVWYGPTVWDLLAQSNFSVADDFAYASVWF